jgi:PAS domain S-box-containing protein
MLSALAETIPGEHLRMPAVASGFAFPNIELADSRRRRNEALRESEDRYRVLFDMSPVAVYSIDSSGVIQEFNRVAAELWGREPALGDTDERFCGSFKLFRPDGSFMPHEQCPMAQVVSGEISEARDAEVLIERPDGSRITVIVNIRPLKGSNGEITGAINCFYDITERFRIERERQQQADALADLNRRKDEFLAMLGHELRTPLASIRNGVEILRRFGRDEQKAQPATEMMQRQGEHMARLVDDLLDMSRIARAKIELRKEPVELASAVHHAVEAVRPFCESMGHELTVTLPPEPMYLNADRVRVGQVVSNLLNNAFKFTDKGGRIWLTAEREGNQVVIRVQDTGVGIAAEQLPRIFGMFAQADTSLERSRDGLGLGLTLVKNLVEMHAGTVEARSAGIGQGSEFVVRLPLLSGPAPSLSREPSSVKPVTTVPRRILVVDDNQDSADSLATLLRLTGHEVHIAHDGLEALERAAALQPEVILLDIGLPRLNGYDAARRIRGQQPHRPPTLVALTGWGQEEDRRRTKEAGFDAHLVKPVDFAALTKLLAESGAN